MRLTTGTAPQWAAQWCRRLMTLMGPGESVANQFYPDPEHPRTDQSAGGWLPATHDDYFVIANRQGEPIAHVPYRIQLSGGYFEEGVTDANGKTHMLTQTLNAQKFCVWVKAPNV